MTTSVTQVANTSHGNEAVHKRSGGDHGLTFREILSAINPLQYLPVVGTIYRAVTGDVIPEGLRRAGSLAVSFLLGGPIGVMTSIALTIAEKMTGIDPEKILARQFDHGDKAVPDDKVIEIVTDGRRTGASEEGRSSILASTLALTSATPASLALSPAQLAAYGVRLDASGTLWLGDVKGADVLNTIELGRHAKAAAAYAAAQSNS